MGGRWLKYSKVTVLHLKSDLCEGNKGGYIRGATLGHLPYINNAT